MVQKEKEIKANTKFLRQEVHLHRETDVSAFFILVGEDSHFYKWRATNLS